MGRSSSGQWNMPIAASGVDEDFARQVSEFIAEYRPALSSPGEEMKYLTPNKFYSSTRA